MAMFYHPPAVPIRPPDLYYHAVRSVIVLIAACSRARSVGSCAGSSSQHSGRDRA